MAESDAPTLQAQAAKDIADQFLASQAGGVSRAPAGPPAPNMSMPPPGDPAAAPFKPLAPPVKLADVKQPPVVGGMTANAPPDTPDPFRAGVGSGETARGDVADEDNSGEGTRAPPPPNAPPRQGPPGIMVPGGFHPSEMKDEVKEGKPVPEETRQANDIADRLDASAAEKTRDADVELHQREYDAAMAKMQANREASADQAKVAAEHASIVQQKIADIQNLNQEALKKIDPDKFWTDRGALATVIGTFARGLGQFAALANGGRNDAGDALDAAVNRDIQAQVHNHNIAAEGAKAATNMYGLYLDKFKNEGMAVEATRLAHFDAIEHQMEMFKAQHGAQVSDVNYNKMLADIARKRGDTLNTLAKQAAAEKTHNFSQKWSPPHLLDGSGGNAPKEQPNLLTTSDGKTYQLPNEQIYNKAVARAEVLDRLQAMNTEILKNRKAATKLLDSNLTVIGDTNYATAMKTINDLGQRKMELVSQMAEQGVLRKDDVAREEQYGIDPAAGLGIGKRIPYFAEAERNATDAALKRQSERYTEDVQGVIRVTGAHEVQRGYAGTPTGLAPATQYTGHDTVATPRLAPSSFRSADKSGQAVQPPPIPVEDEPYLGQRKPAAAGGGHKKKKDE